MYRYLPIGIKSGDQRGKLDSTALAALIRHNTTVESRKAFRHPELWPLDATQQFSLIDNAYCHV